MVAITATSGRSESLDAQEPTVSLGEVRPPMWLVFVCLLGAAARAQQTAGDHVSLEGRSIARIDFDPPQQVLSREELNSILPLQVGSPLKQADVRVALQKLYETGRYANVSIDAEPFGNQTVVRITTEMNYFIGSVTIDGAQDPPNRGQLLTAAKLELGTTFSQTDVRQAIENMQERLRANGFYKADIQYKLEPDSATGEMGVHFDLRPGDRAHFDGIDLKGSYARTLEDIINTTHWHRGIGPIKLSGWREATQNRLQSGIERLRKSFQGSDRLLARVTLERLDYRNKTNTVMPSIVIENGPIIRVRTTGAGVSQGKLRQLIPIFEERTVDRSLLVEGNRNLVDYFQAQGYFDAQSDFTQRSDEPDLQEINYMIERNDRHKLVRIGISGNHFFDEDTIRERLSLRTAGLLRYRYGRYSQKMRDQDRDAIRALYRSNGFRDAVVNVSTIDDYDGRHDQLAVEFTIQEGSQWLIEGLDIKGVSNEEETYLRGVIQSTVGQVYSDSGISADRDTILSYFLNLGYTNVTFDWSDSLGSVPNRVNLHYTVNPGERLFVRSVSVRGLGTTRPSLVSTRIAIHSGDPISQSRISDSQQKLYDLGIFSKVQTALQNPDGEEERKYVLFQLDEAAKYSFTVGFGAELARIGGGVTTFDSPAGETSFSPRVSFGISRLNLFGLAHTIGLQTLVSTLEQRAVLLYTAPQFTGNENLTLTVSGLFDHSLDVRTFDARRWEGSIQLAQRLSRANSVQYRFSFRRSTIDENTLKISPELIPLLSQPVRVGIYSMTFIQDRRDNPIDSHRGIYNTIDAGISLPQFGSETDFTRLLLRNSTYHPITRDIVIARTLQFGYMQRIGGSPEIPLAERFYAGGASSHRAFPDNQAGPRDLDTGFPIGGTALLFHSTELRFPLFGDNIGGVLFHDMGNVHSDIQNLSFRFRQKNIQDFDYMVHSIGFGIRYRTPVGPIRLDLSFSPNSPRFHGFQGTQDQLLAGQGTLTDQRINQFQFHFSLGQTF